MRRWQPLHSCAQASEYRGRPARHAPVHRKKCPLSQAAGEDAAGVCDGNAGLNERRVEQVVLQRTHIICVSSSACRWSSTPCKLLGSFVLDKSGPAVSNDILW